MGRQSYLQRLDAIEELFAGAVESANRNDWLSSYVYYSELCNLNDSSFSRVMRLEIARLLGLVDALGAVQTPTLAEIVDTLGTEHSRHLLAALLRVRGIEPGQIGPMEMDLLTSDRDVLASYIAGYRDILEPRDWESCGVQVVSCSSIRTAASESIEVFGSYDATIPLLNVTSSIHAFDQHPQRTHFLSADVIRLAGVDCTVGSEFMTSDDGSFIDGLLLEGARTANTRDDSRILFSSESEVFHFATTDASAAEVEEPALWLAYAGTDSWGEWFNYSLLRAALAAEVDFMGARIAVVAEETPETYLKGLSQLFPELRLVRLPRGTHVRAKALIVVPARFCNPSHEYWSLEGDSHRVHSEPQTNSVVGKYLRRLAKPVDHATSGKIFMSRANARYRRGNTEQILELLALKHGFKVTEMGHLSLSEQVGAALSGRTFFGQCGSNWDLLSSVIAPHTKTLLIHHDRPSEWAAQAWVMQVAGATCEFILGTRNFLGIGYGPETYHLPVHLDSEQIEAVQNWLEAN